MSSKVLGKHIEKGTCLKEIFVSKKFNHTIILIVLAVIGVILQRIFFLLLVIPIGILSFILLLLGVSERVVEIIFWICTTIILLPWIILTVLDLLVPILNLKIIKKENPNGKLNQH